MSIPNALCILDGGYLSAVCAVVAVQQFEQVHAVICSVGWQSQIELESAIALADILRLSSHTVMDLSPLFAKTVSLKATYSRGQNRLVQPLLNGSDPTFASASNLLILTMAANHAATKEINHIVLSVGKEDFAQEGDHLQKFIDSMAQVLGEGLWRDARALTIHTPLKHLTNTDCIRLAADTLGDQFQDIFEFTHDCSLGVEGGCGQCQNCWNRDRAFQEAGIEDPIWKFRHPEFGNSISQTYQPVPRLG
ncbi:7-cyano-7-deazaguanine synthase [Leptothermofonsia sichuanensis E412]|uniref:7-cyano-7-deazaguanine synthase n=1 Tax=Leptothermofonsia sichuanensis TaxID=2917832 RepID=UPI001CA67B66|nr:7-cyano-7-deazaguanine synthase [Leptothermofonsia sichuanensis]QZZ23209.1 7-cyano-7-deazaguanine synthase [Leptothermofonsia sichuanensis E412]